LQTCLLVLVDDRKDRDGVVRVFESDGHERDLPFPCMSGPRFRTPETQTLTKCT
jgi:hypothetical protein